MNPNRRRFRYLMIAATVVYLSLFVYVTHGIGPDWLWVTDHCPEASIACGSPPLGLIPMALAAAPGLFLITWLLFQVEIRIWGHPAET